MERFTKNNMKDLLESRINQFKMAIPAAGKKGKHMKFRIAAYQDIYKEIFGEKFVPEDLVGQL